MELKATLNKPVSSNVRTRFIIEHNHKLNREIRETDTAIEAWEYTSVELKKMAEKKDIANEIAMLKRQLAETDYIAAKLVEAETSEEVTALRKKYAETIAQRKEWRARINTLESKR